MWRGVAICGVLIALAGCQRDDAGERSVPIRVERECADGSTVIAPRTCPTTTTTTSPPPTAAPAPTTAVPVTSPPTTRATAPPAPRLIAAAETEGNQSIAVAYVRQQAPSANPTKLEPGYLIDLFGRLCDEIATAGSYGGDAPRQLIEALYRNSTEVRQWTSAVITGGILSTCSGERWLLQYVG